ncbi:MAG: VRR-NUC domain-containing protein [Bacteroidota bacterium]
MKPKQPKILEKVKPLLEKEITKNIRDFLRMRGIFHWKVRQGLGCVKGIPDIIGVMPTTGTVPGTMLAIEVKTEKGVLSEHQENFLRAINDFGGIAFVARSVQDVIDNLKDYW